jgi:hypothetical protein
MTAEPLIKTEMSPREPPTSSTAPPRPRSPPLTPPHPRSPPLSPSRSSQPQADRTKAPKNRQGTCTFNVYDNSRCDSEAQWRTKQRSCPAQQHDYVYPIVRACRMTPSDGKPNTTSRADGHPGAISPPRPK